MKIFKINKAIFSVVILLFSANVFALDLNNPRQALQAYVEQDDGAFRYDHLASFPGNGFTIHLYNLVSQVWRSSDEIDRTVWQHQLVIVVPDNVISDTGMLFVGDNDNDYPVGFGVTNHCQCGISDT